MKGPPRPSVSVIVPFSGSENELAGLRTRLEVLAILPGDELIISDNRAHPIHTPAYTRNRGADGAHGEWLVFLDADTVPGDRLLEAYFDPPPGERTGVVAGGIADIASPGHGLSARHAVSRRYMTHRITLERCRSRRAREEEAERMTP